jgi:Na+-driven multidrug efflux pump
MGFALFAVVGLAVAVNPDAVMHVFCKDQPVIDIAAPILRILALFAPVMCIALVFMYALYGAGNSRFVMMVELVLHFSCLIPISYVLALPLGLGLWGAWMAMMAYVLLMAILMTWKFREGSWKHIRI